MGSAVTIYTNRQSTSTTHTLTYVCISSILFTSSKAPVHINGMYHVGVFIFTLWASKQKRRKSLILQGLS